MPPSGLGTLSLRESRFFHAFRRRFLTAFLSRVNTYRSLKDAVLDLDPLLIRTLGALSIETRPEGHLVLFRFMLYGQNLERETDVEQCPDVEVLLDSDLDPDEELRELEECEIVGGLNTMKIESGWPGAGSGGARWVVKTHAGSQGERIEWRNSIG